MQTASNCVLVGLLGIILRGREVQTASNCVLVVLWGENCKAGLMCSLQEIVCWSNCGGEL